VSKHEPDDPQNEIFFLESPKFLVYVLAGVVSLIIASIVIPALLHALKQSSRILVPSVPQPYEELYATVKSDDPAMLAESAKTW